MHDQVPTPEKVREGLTQMRILLHNPEGEFRNEVIFLFFRL
jgi:hypothetical protein